MTSTVCDDTSDLFLAHYNEVSRCVRVHVLPVSNVEPVTSFDWGD